tara:strand:- start:289 stop:504 length:216 start_codon:yes stop_codon:yes gene_type:complete
MYDWFVAILLVVLFAMSLRTMLMVNALGQLTFAVAHRAVDIMDELDNSIDQAKKAQEELDPSKWRDWDGIA